MSDFATLALPAKTSGGRTLDAMDELHMLVRNFDTAVRTEFSDRFSLPQLLLIHRAWLASGWDKSPDTWTERQIRDALAGRPPEWDDDEKPVYAPGPDRWLDTTDQGGA